MFFEKLGKRAFTLAEVLITLGVIGIVAAISIPPLVAKYQKAQTLSQLKKTYSLLNNVYEKGKADYGSIENWGLPDWNAGDYTTKWKTIYDNILAPNLKVTKDCGAENSHITSQCWAYGYNFVE